MQVEQYSPVAPAFPRSRVILGALLPTLVLALVKGFYQQPLFGLSPAFLWAVDVFQWIVVPATSLFVLAELGGVRPRDYGLWIPGDKRSLWGLAFITLYVTIILGTAHQAASALACHFGATEPSGSVYAQAVSSEGGQLLAVLYLAVTAGVVGEVFFRGLPWLYLSRLLGRRPPLVLYALTSSILFAAAHWELGGAEVSAAFVFGLAACLIYKWLGNLWPLILAHILVGLLVLW